MKKEKIVNRFNTVAAVILSAVLLLPITAGDIAAAEKKLIPFGKTTGIKMFSGGAMIVGFASSEAGGGPSPARLCGLKVGDVISAVNGQAVESNEELSAMMSSLSDDCARLTVIRERNQTEIEVKGLLPSDKGGYILGAWVRDSMAGIGTITYIDPETGAFGALGHGICDVDSGILMPFDNGSIMPSTVTGAIKGKSGTPGQLVGSFDLKTDSGLLLQNTSKGIFGCITDSGLYSGLEAVEIAPLDQVKCGKIEILSNIDGEEIGRYSAKIVKLLKDEGGCRDFVIEITDERLIDKTGGIVQGMSGSPILQDGKLIGAVTHVLVNDPTRGYGISIENMIGEAQKAELKAA